MALVFPKKKKRKIPLYPLLMVFTITLVIVTIIGEGGLLHSFAMRIHKKNAENVAEYQHAENNKVQNMIFRIRKNPQRAKLLLAERGMLAEKDSVIYHFRDYSEINSEQVIDEIEGLSWYQRIVLRFNLLIKS